jgi:hypothetical protein
LKAEAEGKKFDENLVSFMIFYIEDKASIDTVGRGSPNAIASWAVLAAEESLNFNILLLKIRGNMTF